MNALFSLGVTDPKQRSLLAITVVLGLSVAAFAAAAQWRLAGATAAVLLTLVAVLTIVRRNSRGRHREQPDVAVLAERVAALEEASRSQQVASQISKANKSQTREIEALLQLHGWVETNEPMPPSGPWAMNPQGLLTLYGLVRRNRPRVVLELGSGTSTVWLAYALAANGPVGNNGAGTLGRLVSIDHEPDYAAQSRQLLSQHADNVAPAEVRYAPLEPWQIGGEHFDWYSRDSISDLTVIDMLIVDGPPSGTGPLARYPAVGALLDRLADGAVVVLDDATRGDERATAERWMAETDGLSRESSPINRLAVFRYSRRASAVGSSGHIGGGSTYGSQQRG